MKLKKFIAAALMAVMSFTTLTACGGSDSKEKKTAEVIEIDLTDEEYAFGVDKNQPELLEEVNAFIKKIKEDGTFDEICDRNFGEGEPMAITSAELDESKDQLIVATNAAFEPFEYTKGDKYYGVDMEIAYLLAQELGKELVIMNMDFDAVCLSVGQQKCDIAMAGLTIKEDRKEYVNFSDPYYEASQRLIVVSGDTTFDDCKTAEDVEKILNELGSDVKVGVQNGTTGQFYCEGDEEWGFTGFGFETVPYKNGALAVQDLLNNNLKYVIIDAAPAQFITESINKMQ